MQTPTWRGRCAVPFSVSRPSYYDSDSDSVESVGVRTCSDKHRNVAVGSHLAMRYLLHGLVDSVEERCCLVGAGHAGRRMRW